MIITAADIAAELKKSSSYVRWLVAKGRLTPPREQVGGSNIFPIDWREQLEQRKAGISGQS